MSSRATLEPPWILSACLALFGGVGCTAPGDGPPTGEASSAEAGASHDGAARGASPSNASGSANGAAAGFSNSAWADGGATRRGPDGRACATTTHQAEQIPANLLFVVDRSGSMSCCPPPITDSATCESFPRKADCQSSKWDVTRNALRDVIGQLRALGNVSAGMTVFPRDDQCAVATAPDIDVSPLDDAQVALIDDFLDSGVSPSGSTPLVGATTLSYAYLQSAFGDRLLRENTFVVVVTDGAERCAEDQIDVLFDTNVVAARRIHIRTFVIGAPGSEGARDMLSELAFQGGTARQPDCVHSRHEQATAVADAGPQPEGGSASPDGALPAADSGTSAGYCHFDMTESADFGAELREALDEISQSRELSCEFDVPTNPTGGGVDLDKVNVSFTPRAGSPEHVLRDDTKACDGGAEGWQYAENETKIVLCGEICDRVRADRHARIEIVLGCPTEKVKFQ